MTQRKMKEPVDTSSPADRALEWGTFLAVAAALYLIFMWVPNEKIQGPVSKIIYFHIASAWLAFFAFFIVMICSILYLKTKDLKWDIISYASAEIGILFTTIVLVTGPIWGRASWNAWWTWDHRLTTTLILWFIYIAYLMIRSAFNEEEKKARFSAVFGIIGLDVYQVVAHHSPQHRFFRRFCHGPVYGTNTSGKPGSLYPALFLPAPEGYPDPENAF